MSDTAQGTAVVTTNTANPPQNTNVDDLPGWARDALSKANNEAANYRVQLRNKETEATTALNELAAMKDKLTAAETVGVNTQTEFTKLKVALAAGIPGDKAVDFAALLKGATEEELKAHADTVKGLMGTPHKDAATDDSQGHGTDSPANTPEAAFAQMVKSQLDGVLNR